MSVAAAPRTSLLVKHMLLVVAAILVLFPFLWIAAAAFKTQIALLTGQILFQPTLRNFEKVLFSSTSDYAANFFNSFVVGAVSTALVLTIATLAAYSLQRMKWPAWMLHSMLGWSIVFHMVPPITLAGAWYSIFRTIGLDNSYTGLILAHTTLNLPMALWMMGVFVRDVPIELIDAARIDGAETPNILRHVVVPLVKPGLAAAGILSFIFSWNEFAVVLTLSQRQTATVPVAIGKYAQENTVAFTEMAAASMLSMLPAVILLLIAQRFIVRGLTSGAVK